MPIWEVVGGSEKGGILVREGEGLKTAESKERLSTGAMVEQIELKGERLHYRLLKGAGPAEGWVSMKVGGKPLLKAIDEKDNDSKANGEENLAGSLSDHGSVEVDASLKAKIQEMSQRKISEDAFAKYVPKYKVHKNPLSDCRLRIFCFHNAGSTENNYTGLKTPFIEWVKSTGVVEIVAVNFPGRETVRDMKYISNTQDLAMDLLAVLYEKIADGTPYLIWGHSVGTWVSFELVILARKVGLPMPRASFWMAFPAPHMPEKMRRWRKSRNLDGTELKKELTDWDVAHFDGPGQAVFDPKMWEKEQGGIYEDMMRADFPLYDEYVFMHAGAPKFDFPIHAWHMENEKLNYPEQIQMWKDWTSKNFDFKVMKSMGHLTCFYKPDCKKEYFSQVTELMRGYCG